MFSRTLLIAGALQAFFLLVLLLRKQPKHKADKYLICWIGLIGLNLLFFYDATGDTPSAPIQFQMLGFFLPLLHTPVLLAYLHQLTAKRKIRGWEIGLHGLPYVLGVGLLIFYHYSPGITLSFQKGFTYLEGHDPLGLCNYLGIFIAVSACGYAFAGLYQLRAYRLKLPGIHANPDLVSLNWFRYLTIAAILFFFLVFIIIQFGPGVSLIGSGQVFVFVGMLTTIYVFCFGYFGLRHRVLLPVEGSSAPLLTKEREGGYLNSGLTESSARSLYASLLEHMERTEAYLDEGLSLTALALQIGCPPNHLSQIINQNAQTNFFGFINAYRVEAIKQKLLDPKNDHFTILALALDCGFGSKASFNKVFKATTGETPSSFRKNRLK